MNTIAPTRKHAKTRIDNQWTIMVKHALHGQQIIVNQPVYCSGPGCYRYTSVYHIHDNPTVDLPKTKTRKLDP